LSEKHCDREDSRCRTNTHKKSRLDYDHSSSNTNSYKQIGSSQRAKRSMEIL
jgi:hypothetical protein